MKKYFNQGTIYKSLTFQKWLQPMTYKPVLILLAVAVLGGGGGALLVERFNHGSNVSPSDTSKRTISNVGVSPQQQQASQASSAAATTTAIYSNRSSNSSNAKQSSNANLACHTEVIPYATTTQYLNNQYNDYSYNVGGSNGSKIVCSDGTSEVAYAPDNMVHYVGTIDRAAEKAAQEAKDAAAYNQVIDYCRSHNPTGGPISGCVEEVYRQYLIDGSIPS